VADRYVRQDFFVPHCFIFYVVYLPSVQVQLYLIDSFAFPASAFAAAALFESLLAFAFPLFGQDLYLKLGYGGGNSLLAALGIVLGIPFPIWIWYKGETIRKRSAVYMSPAVRPLSPIL
jgi:hypothetical protein